MQQATVNLLADMRAQPTTLKSGLKPATASTDTVTPLSAITSPSAGATIAAGSTITITGTASDAGGVVGGVEVSTDGGASWRAAKGRANWSYTWQPASGGARTILSRATDDSLNIETPSAGVSVQVTEPTGPWSIWNSSTTPSLVNANDPNPLEVGVKVQASRNGYITAIRFYKGSQNTGTHTGSLWSATGTQLATTTFINETASGWQQANFSSSGRRDRQHDVCRVLLRSQWVLFRGCRLFPDDWSGKRSHQGAVQPRGGRQRCVRIQLHQPVPDLQLPVKQLLGGCDVQRYLTCMKRHALSSSARAAAFRAEAAAGAPTGGGRVPAEKPVLIKKGAGPVFRDCSPCIVPIHVPMWD